MEKTFEFEGKNYTIVKENDGENERCFWEEKLTDAIREREIYAWRPWWVGKKFRWLRKIKVKESLRFIRFSDFDGGWTYKNYWKPWKMEWNVIEILS